MKRIKRPKLTAKYGMLLVVGLLVRIMISAVRVQQSRRNAVPHSSITKQQQQPIKIPNTMTGYYRSIEELEGRKLRFPSVEQRLKVYLSTWYVPPCDKRNGGRVQYDYLSSNSNNSVVVLQEAGNNNYRLSVNASTEQSRVVLLMNQTMIKQCSHGFCLDVVRFFLPVWDRLPRPINHTAPPPPLLLQFGDAEQYRATIFGGPQSGRFKVYPTIPVIKKFRHSMEASTIDTITRTHCYKEKQPELAATIRDPLPRTHPIISIVSSYNRHFGALKYVPNNDVPWEEKLDAAVFRGALTGKNRIIGINPNTLTDTERCHRIPRCRFVSMYGGDESQRNIDARLVYRSNASAPISIPGMELYGDNLSMKQLLQYKVLILLEGNDVASGLKWALFSESVVMMPHPTCTSWAMEELLEPWVHYVPIANDFEDVNEQLEWVIQNDQAARQIAKRGRLWITDLLFHPDSEKDNDRILERTFRAYAAHFVHNSSLLT